MTRESFKSFLARFEREAEEDKRKQAESVGGRDAEGSKIEDRIEQRAEESTIAGEEKEKGEKTYEEKLGGEKRRWNSDVKVSERYNEDDADITIISSDGVAFKVHSLLLTRASSVFKNMIGIAQSNSQRDPIDLTDTFVEMSLVVRAVLDILYDQEVISFKDDKLYHHVIEFARKYNMGIILKTISKEIRVHATSLDKSHHVLRLFRVAIDLGEYDLITAIVRAKGSYAWPKPAKDQIPELGSLFPSKTLTVPKPFITGSAKEYVPGAKAFDLGGWPYSTFAALPTPLAWALLRAHLTAEKPFMSDGSESIGRELQKVLDSMYPGPSSNTNADEVGVAPSVQGFSFGTSLSALGNTSAASSSFSFCRNAGAS